MSETLNLAMQLMACPSVTPVDEGCQPLMIARLERLGFEVRRLRFGAVDNFWAQRGTAGPVVAFAGHSDVVPPGPREQWTSDPFKPEVRAGILYGRGAADMKGSLAAFVTAIEAFVARHPRHTGTLALLITSDEEGPAVEGTAKVMEWLGANGRRIDYCVVGEPSCQARLGDVIKIGRRGSLNGRLAVHGIQGHIAYPRPGTNPIHEFARALNTLVSTEWDQGNEHFPPTSFQVSNIHAGTGAENVTPGELTAQFNFRFSTAVTDSELRQRVEDVLTAAGLRYDLAWQLSGQPFLTAGGPLLRALRQAVRDILGVEPSLSTAGGTSDGRFIAPTGAEVAEFGPINQSIHRIDECVPVADLDLLAQVYTRTLEHLLA
ncbi:MAG: succinyl-diaminopimelate desuccinylase [Gammaproteobacteria bacterium]|nr:succinyl-diaminopimelate desuccinylase [Gammaproteobacteria bacterium]